MSRKDCMKMEQMTEDEIKRKLEDIRNEWLKIKFNKMKKAKQREMLVCGNLQLLKQYQEQYPEGYEKYYWNTYRCLERDNVWRDAIVGIIQVLGLIVADIGVLLTALNPFFENKLLSFYDRKIAVIYICIFLALAVVICLTIPYVLHCFKTKKHSYYRIFVAMMTDLKNAGKVPEIAETQKDKEEVKSGKKGNK